MNVIKSITENYNIRGETVKVTSKRKINKNTGKLVFDEYLDNIASVKALNIYRKRHNIISPNQVRTLRHTYGLSQRDFATLLGWSPTTIVTYEDGLLPSNGHNKTLQLLLTDKSLAVKLFNNAKSKISLLGQRRFDKFMHNNKDTRKGRDLIDIINLSYEKVNGTEYTGYSKFDLSKFANLVIYFVSKISEVTETKLCKLLFYSDFLNYDLETVSITGTPYVKLPHGPVPDEYRSLYELLADNHLIIPHIKNFGNYDGTYYTSNKELFDKKLFTKGELRVIKFIANYFADTNASKLSKLSHKESGWKENKKGHNISYKYGLDPAFLKKYINNN